MYPGMHLGRGCVSQHAPGQRDTGVQGGSGCLACADGDRVVFVFGCGA